MSACDHSDRFKNWAYEASLQDKERRTMRPGALGDCEFVVKIAHFTCAVKGAGSLRVKVPPGNCSLHPVAIGAAVKETKPSEPPV